MYLSIINERFVAVAGERSAGKLARSVRGGAVEDTGNAVRRPPTLLNTPRY